MPPELEGDDEALQKAVKQCRDKLNAEQALSSILGTVQSLNGIEPLEGLANE